MTRKDRRQEAAEERERRALDALVAGGTPWDIAQAAGVAAASVQRLLDRALARREIGDPEVVAQARQLHVMRLERLIAAFWPAATGSLAPAEGEDPPRPDLRAAELILKVLDRWAAVMGVAAPRRVQVDVDVRGAIPDNVDAQREMVLRALREAADKQRTIDGRLADATADLRQLSQLPHDPDRPPPPPAEEQPA